MQKPRSKLSKILCDADVDNFARKDFFIKGNNLFRELNGRTDDPVKLLNFLKFSLSLLVHHKFHTKKWQNHRRTHKKQSNIDELKERIKSFEFQIKNSNLISIKNAA